MIRLQKIYLLFIILSFFLITSCTEQVDYYNLGVQYQKQGRWQEAIDMYKQGLELNPRDADCYFGLAIVYEELGSITDAIEAYEKCVKIKPMGGAYANLAMIYEKLGLLEQAADNYVKAQKVFEKQGRKEDVQRMYEATKRLSAMRAQ